MFDRITIYGATAEILWGCRTAASFSSWTITKDGPRWILRATLAGVDRFQVKRSPLIFTAPLHYGRCCWPVVGDVQVGDRTLVATLGQPEM